MTPWGLARKGGDNWCPQFPCIFRKFSAISGIFHNFSAILSLSSFSCMNLKWNVQRVPATPRMLFLRKKGDLLPKFAKILLLLQVLAKFAVWGGLGVLLHFCRELISTQKNYASLTNLFLQDHPFH